jgi:protein tyrosine phosphatase (PTP) superfamily phosphohydrolase (DUF442 family)
MKPKKITTTIILAAAITLAVTLVCHFHIKHLVCIEPDILYSSGQPRGMDYERLIYKYHIATIVNLRSKTEHREQNWHNEEIAFARKHGVNYIELPIEKHARDALAPNAQVCAKFIEIMSSPENLPVLIHGNSGTKRTAPLAAVWLAHTGQYSFDDIMKAVLRIRKGPLEDSETTFYTNLRSTGNKNADN